MANTSKSNLGGLVADIARGLRTSPSQTAADEKATQVVRNVHQEMRGQPADEILVELRRRLSSFGEVNESNLQMFAEAIQDNTLFVPGGPRRLHQTVKLQSPLQKG